jgi:LacI family transcriptional regulator
MQTDLSSLLAKSKKPVVLLNVNNTIQDAVCFNIDNYHGAYSITKHLIDHGYKRIGMILGPEGNCDAEERFRGFSDALAKHDLSMENSLIIQGDFTAKSGYYGFGRLMNQEQKPDAIFAANDMMAVGCFEAAKSSNTKIPADVAIAGFDDIYLGRLLSPQLTTVHVPISELGSKAIRYLLRMINGEVDSDQPYREELSTGLVMGGSCGCNNYSVSSIL